MPQETYLVIPKVVKFSVLNKTIGINQKLAISTGDYQHIVSDHKLWEIKLCFVWFKHVDFFISGGVYIQETPDGEIIPVQQEGTAEKARIRVREYFRDLRETIQHQENEALTVINSYIREKLCALRQQQEDMTVLTSQISNVCLECDRAVKRSDAEVNQRPICSEGTKGALEWRHFMLLSSSGQILLYMKPFNNILQTLFKCSSPRHC